MSYNISNRRYTGSKAKLADWIMELIAEHCSGDSFFDIFAGTGVISEKAIGNYKRIIINDLLFSNNTIYRAFFEQTGFNVDKLTDFKNKYTSLVAEKLKGNYVSNNFGGKFFSIHDAKLIGYIREDIEKSKKLLNEKEYNILIASLLYSLDKSANTVGHFEAYFQNNQLENRFVFDLIEPLHTDCNIGIYRRDANELCKEIASDIVYIDPPYNSRQYSRFYHVLENITKWEKPKLYGVALKPETENMSDYCRSNAPTVFADLIADLNCKNVVVSYNNTYNSKSKSSQNKIDLSFILQTLQSRGKVKIFEKSHPHFNAGKTDFGDHKEYIFILKVGA